MARDFEDHCWRDIVDDEILEIYEPYRREVHVGRNPAVLAIDLYNKAYQGGNRPLREVNRRYPGSCGENALHHPPCRHRRRALDQSSYGQGGGGAISHQGRAHAPAG